MRVALILARTDLAEESGAAALEEAFRYADMGELCALYRSLAFLPNGERFMPETPQGFAAPLFLAFVAQVGGQGLIIAGLGRTPAAIAGIIVLIQPVFAAAISWQLFDEPLSPLQGGGAALILFGIWLSQGGVKRRRQRRSASKSSQDAVTRGS